MNCSENFNIQSAGLHIYASEHRRMIQVIIYMFILVLDIC